MRGGRRWAAAGGRAGWRSVAVLVATVVVFGAALGTASGAAAAETSTAPSASLKPSAVEHFPGARAAIPMPPERSAASAPSVAGQGAAETMCPENVRREGFEGRTIDVKEYGASYGCLPGQAVWGFGFTAWNAWADSNLGLLVFGLDTDLNKKNGCDGMDYTIVLFYAGGMQGGVYRETDCDSDSQFVGDLTFARPDGSSIGLGVDAALIGNPSSLDFAMYVGVRSPSGDDLDRAPNAGVVPVRTVSLSAVGGGSAAMSAGGASCTSPCSAKVLGGTSVMFGATPATGRQFGWWAGGCKGTSPTCTVTVKSTVNVAANFGRPGMVRVTRAGSGASVSSVASAPAGVSCGTTCAFVFTPGATVTLTATAPSGKVFAGWSGACTGSNTVCTVTAGQPKLATATFVNLAASSAASEMVASQKSFNCTLQAKGNNQYVAAELGQTGERQAMLRARSASVGAWEKFECVALGNNRWALRSRANNAFVVAEFGYPGAASGLLRAGSATSDGWEQFTISTVNASQSTVAFRSAVVSGIVVAAEVGDPGDNAGRLRARSTSVGAWEQFTLRIDPT